MTEAQRNYLADLAARKSVILENTDEVSASWASAKIEELKAMPDASFEPISDANQKKIERLTNRTLEELGLWTFRK